MFFTIEKIENQLKEIRGYIHREAIDIPRFKYFEGESGLTIPGVHCPEFDDRKWADFQVGEFWGGYDRVAWFRTWVPILPGWKDKKLALRFLVGPRDGGNSTVETLLYVNGRPLQGIDVWHEEAWLPPEDIKQDVFFIALKAWSGVYQVPERRRFKIAQLLRIDEGAEEFFYLADNLVKTVKLMDENDLRRTRLLELLNQSFHCINFLKPGSDHFYQSIASSAQFLKAGLERLQVSEIKPRVTGIGHAHIDMAWLWRLAHTREKAARTFATVLHLMRQYPDYRFMHSSPQLYKFLKEDYPDIFQQVKSKIAQEEWEITGGMWVEADTNLPGGESLVRQFLLGLRFMRQEFGVESLTLWLPDVFGYSAALPQIARKSGIQYFLTSKVSWSQFNHFPYDTFNWRGIDGTELLTHFVTTPEKSAWFYTYNGQLDPSEVKGIWDNYRQKDVNDELLLLYGWGDGGGGPTKEMLESARALKNLPGLPEVALGTAESYFERLEKRLAGKELPVWDGELYLEYHRGTYTSQAFIKRANRVAEILYHNAEWLSALADILTRKSDYPAEMLRAGWELILLNQFHDILPGSSIRQVYQDCRADYHRIYQLGELAISQARQSLLGRISASQDSVIAFNSLSWQRDGVVELPWPEEAPLKTIQSNSGSPGLVQRVSAGGQARILVEVQGTPSFGYQVYPLVSVEQQDQSPEQSPEEEMIISSDYLENHFYRLQLNRLGQITSLYDKQNDREVLAPGACGNVFQAFEDKPMKFDAWDIDIYYQEKMLPVIDLDEAVVEETGPIRGVLRLCWRLADSSITQRLTLYRHSPRIDFRTDVDWHERQVLLKVGFPVNVRATRATYDIQFGNLERPTHWNTSWDYARFESVGHKWVDLSEGNYGVSLLNDCKYGHDIKNNVIRLTLIKSAVNPDETADQGKHTFTYSLLPHAGDWRQGNIVQESYVLNYPLLASQIPAQKGDLPTRYQFVEVNSGNVIVETVKKAEDEQAWIVRVYEFQQNRTKAVQLTFGNSLSKAVECNLMEEDEHPVFYHGNKITFDISPYEIKTFKVWF